MPNTVYIKRNTVWSKTSSLRLKLANAFLFLGESEALVYCPNESAFPLARMSVIPSSGDCLKRQLRLLDSLGVLDKPVLINPGNESTKCRGTGFLSRTSNCKEAMFCLADKS